MQLKCTWIISVSDACKSRAGCKDNQHDSKTHNCFTAPKQERSPLMALVYERQCAWADFKITLRANVTVPAGVSFCAFLLLPL